jgi:hypothetical protein
VRDGGDTPPNASVTVGFTSVATPVQGTTALPAVLRCWSTQPSVRDGSQWQSAWIESFNGRLLEGLLNGWHFDNLLDAQVNRHGKVGGSRFR